MAARDDPLLVAYRAAPHAKAFRDQLTAEQTAELYRLIDEDELDIKREYAAMSQTPRVEAAPTPTAKRKKKIKQSKEFADRRSRWRETDLNVIVRYSAEVLGKRTTRKALAALFQNRDITNPEDVTGADVGNKLALTVGHVFKFEELASAHAKAQNYAKTVFWFKTIKACDKEADELERRRRERRNERVTQRRREDAAVKRSKAMQTQTATTATAGHKTFADFMAEQKARTRAQCDSLFDVLAKDGESHEVAPLIAAVRRHPAWRNVADDKLYQTAMTRLDMLRDQGRTEDDRKPGPRGSFFRLVRVKNPTTRPLDRASDGSGR